MFPSWKQRSIMSTKRFFKELWLQALFHSCSHSSTESFGMRFGERRVLAKPHLFPWREEGKRALAAPEKVGRTDKEWGNV